eukprot:6464262-Amphidinium_carterae.1
MAAPDWVGCPRKEMGKNNFQNLEPHRCAKKHVLKQAVARAWKGSKKINKSKSKKKNKEKKCC